jgi:serine/threonine protein kinase
MKAPSSIEYAIGEPMPGTKWVVRGKLGQGGMGIVLSVEKAGLIRGAMKVLLPPFAKLPEFAATFLGEVKVTARLQHPSIVQVLDFDQLADGTPFMVMERLRGRTLRAALRETRQHGKLWTAANTYAVAAQAAEGLYRAHSLEPSIVHRDVKPENIFLQRRGSSNDSVVKVMDFGVAAVVGERDRQTAPTVVTRHPRGRGEDGSPAPPALHRGFDPGLTRRLAMARSGVHRPARALPRGQPTGATLRGSHGAASTLAGSRRECRARTRRRARSPRLRSTRRASPRAAE